MNAEDPTLTSPRDQAAPIRLREKIPAAILFTMAFFLILPIPFLIFLIIPDRLSKKARNIVGFVLWGLATVCQLASIVLSINLFTELYPVTITTLDPLAAAPFNFLENNFDMFALMIGLVVLNAIFSNRFATNILANEEVRFRARAFTIIERITLAFKWKNERTALASGNETLMKVKNAYTTVAFLGLFLVVLTIFLPEFKVTMVIEYLMTGDEVLLDSLFVEDFLAAAVYVVVACGLFAIAFFLASFYSGRAITYQGQHYWRQRRFSLAIALKTIGYIVSLSPILPAILCLAGVAPFSAILAMVPVSLVGSCGWLAIHYIFWRQPRGIALDPKARAIKERASVIKSPEHRARWGRQGDLLKSWGFWFLVLAIMGLSIINGAIWFPATVLYAQATDWYDWGFYWWGGSLLL
jgi:hypothetical protein